MAADERNQSSDGFEVFALVIGVVVLVLLIGGPLAFLVNGVLVPVARDLLAALVVGGAP